jgi:hypothetical protein
MVRRELRALALAGLFPCLCGCWHSSGAKLLQRLGSADRDTRFRAVHELIGRGNESPDFVIQVLERAMDLDRDESRNDGLQVLRVLIPLAPARYTQALPLLLTRLKDRGAFIRENAASAVAELEERAGEAVPALLNGLHDESDDVKMAMVGALLRVTSRPEVIGLAVSSIDLLASEHAAGGRSGRRLVVFLGDGVDRVELVVDDRIDGFGLEGLLAPLRIRRRGGRPVPGRGWRAAGFPLTFPRRVPEMEATEDPFDHVFLFPGDRGDDFHRLSARAAKGWVLEPDLGDELGPRSLAFPQERGVLFLGGGAWRGDGIHGGTRRGRDLRWRCGLGLRGNRGRRRKGEQLRGRPVDGRVLDPAHLSAKGSGEGAVGANRDLVLQGHMGNQERKATARASARRASWRWPASRPGP